jgi:hypothetical protein
VRATRRARAGVFGRLVGSAVVFVVLASLAVPLLASASNVTGYQPPSGSSSACPATPLLPGTRAENGSLVAFFQPGPPGTGTTCGLPDGSELVGTLLVVAFYAPSTPPNGSIPIMVEEFSWGTREIHERLPNGTTENFSVPVRTDVEWSNTSIAASPGSPEEFGLNVPTPGSQTNLTVAILGAVLSVAIVAPGSGVPIPVNYPQLLVHDFTWVAYVVVFFVVGIAIATALRLRARHLEGTWKLGAIGMGAAFAFGAWFFSDYPLSVVPIGSAPEAVVALPVVFIAMYFWLALFPTDAKLYQVRYPVADAIDSMPLYDTKRFRVFDGPDGPEYIGEGGATQIQRVLGRRTMLDDRVLTNSPRRVRHKGFRSIKNDVYAEYLSPGETEGGPKVLEVVRPRTWWLPWRQKARAEIEEYHRTALRGRVPPPQAVGALWYTSPSKAFLAASGRAGSMMVQEWITGTMHVSKVMIAFERLHVAFLTLKVSFTSEVMAKAHKIAYTLHLAREIPRSPITTAAIEELSTREEAFLFDQVEWHSFLEQKVKDNEARRPTGGIPAPVEGAVEDTRESRPLQGRRMSRGREPSPTPTSGG